MIMVDGQKIDFISMHASIWKFGLCVNNMICSKVRSIEREVQGSDSGKSNAITYAQNTIKDGHDF